MQKIPVWEDPLEKEGRKDLLEKEMAIHSSILAWEIPMDRGTSGLQSIGLQRIGQNLALNNNIHIDFKFEQ